MIVEQFPEIMALTAGDRRLLAYELLDTVEGEEPATDPAIVELVERRFAEYERDPSTALTLEEFKRRHNLP